MPLLLPMNELTGERELIMHELQGMRKRPCLCTRCSTRHEQTKVKGSKDWYTPPCPRCGSTNAHARYNPSGTAWEES